VFTKQKIAVFIDGCFWHGCPEHYFASKTNVDYWNPKIRENIARDARFTQILIDQGWQVVRIWEHEDPDQAAAKVEDIVRSTSSCSR